MTEILKEILLPTLFYHRGEIIPIITGVANFSLGLWSLHYKFMNVIIIWLAKILKNITCEILDLSLVAFGHS